MNTIKTECSSCGGTGLYSGMCEGKGNAVVCITCNGTGCDEIRYKPFNHRIIRRDIKSVRLSRGGFIVTGVGGIGESISYQEFLNGKFPSLK